MNRRQTTAVAVATMCVAAVAVGYVAMSGDDTLTGTYVFSYTEIDDPGDLVDATGTVIIDMDTWVGSLSELYTSWDGDTDYHSPFYSCRWYSVTIEVWTSPNITISLEDIHIILDEYASAEIKKGEPGYGYETGYIIYSGTLLHSTLTTESITTDESGHGSIAFINLRDQLHYLLDMSATGIEWSPA